MSILSKMRILPQERWDLEDLNAMLSFLCADSKQHTKRFWSGGPYILSGFDVINTVGSTSPLQMTLDGATLVNANNPGAFSWFVGAPSAAPLEAELQSNARNYIELELTNENGTPVTKAFWDPSANSGEGAEFSQTIETVTTLNVIAVVRTGGFSGLPNRLPVAIVDMGASTIDLILDRRELFFRLAEASDPEADYIWTSRTEPTITLNLTGGSGTYVIGETITFGSGATAEVTVGGTTTIEVILLSSTALSSGDSVIGGISGSNRTLVTTSESFSGADKDISDVRENLAALETEVKKIKGTRFWFESAPGSIAGLFSFHNTLISPNTSGAAYSWDGSALSLTDSSGAPADVDTVAKIRRLGSVQELDLTREDGTGGSSTIAIANGEVLFVKLPASGDRAFSGTGAGDTNFQITTRAAFIQNDENYWIAFREGSILIVKEVGELEPGEKEEISDTTSETLLDNLGLEENSHPGYTSDIRGIASEPFLNRISTLTDAVGDEQEDRSAYLRSDEPVTWDGSDLTFTQDIVLDIINTKSGSVTTHTIAQASSPMNVGVTGESIWIEIDRTVNETVTPKFTSVDAIPAQVQANKDVLVLFRRVDVGAAAYLHLPLHKQLIEPGQSVRLGASGSGGTGTGVGLSPADGFKEMVFDELDVLPNLADSKVRDVETTASYDVAKKMYTMQCSKALTAQTVGSAITLSGSPGWTISDGDIVYSYDLNEWRKLSNATTMDIAFSSDLAPGSSVMVSQAVWTKDLVALGDAAQTTRIGDFYPSEAINIIHVDYEDSLTLLDDVSDFIDEARVVAVASNAGTQFASGLQNSDTYAPIFTRPEAPDQILDYPLTDNGAGNSERLILAFFCNPANASVTANANLIRYEASLVVEEVLSNGGYIDSAFAKSDNSATPNNSSQPVAIGGITEWELGFNFVPGLNSGKTEGDLEVRVDGKVIPRKIAGSTIGAYWEEISGSTNKIRFWTDLSIFSYSLEAVRRQGSIDTSDQNALDINILQSGLANRLMNGNIDFIQRNLLTSVPAVFSKFTADRWIVANGGNSAIAVDYPAVTPSFAQTGFNSTRCLRLQSTLAQGVIAASGIRIRQSIEGYNIADLQGGDITLSFWINPSKTGTYSITLLGGGSSYVSSFNVVSGIWQKVEKIIPMTAADASSWGYSTGIGLVVEISLAAGSNSTASTDQWLSGSFQGVTGQDNAFDSPGSSTLVSQIMLLKGSVANATFRRAGRTIQNELALCQRYYEKSYDNFVAPGTVAFGGFHTFSGNGITIGFLQAWSDSIEFKTKKRVIPAVAVYAENGTIHSVSNNRAGNLATDYVFVGETAFTTRNNTGGSVIITNLITFHWTAEAEL